MLVILDLGKKNRSSSNILVVDDEYDIVNSIKQSLDMNGQSVCAFTDPLVALNHFSSDLNDYHSVVISDIRMPGMNGYEFVRQVKKINPKVKVILMTAFEIKKEDFLNVLADVKIDTFIQKPFSLKELRNAVYENCNIKY